MIDFGQKIFLSDGATGSMLRDWLISDCLYNKDLGNDKIYNCPDLLNVTDCQAVAKLHRQYLEAGSDIITTNTINSNAISLSEIGLSDYVAELNKQAALTARAQVNDFTSFNMNRQCLVAGSIGPTAKKLSDNFVEQGLFYDAFKQQASILIDNGVDIIMIETAIDLLTARCALSAAQNAIEHSGKKIALMLSASINITDTTKSIKTLTELSNEFNLSAVGLNCMSADNNLADLARELCRQTQCAISISPNAGCPDKAMRYPLTSTDIVDFFKPLIAERIVDIAGGCCGTTPQHIAALRQLITELKNNEYKN